MPRRTGWRRALTGLFAGFAGLATTIGLTTALAAPASAAGAAPVAVTKYSYTSEAGDYIGGGVSASFTPRNATVTAGGTAEYVRFRVSTDTTWWDVELAAPTGEKLHPGVYRNAERASFRTGRSPGLDVSGDGRGCNELYGQFSVHQIATDDSGAITLLDASYTQHCESADAPALKGTVKYQAYPLSYAYTSDSGDYVGQGAAQTHTGSTSTFGLSDYGDGVQYSVSGKREYWTALITPPDGEQFTAGTTYRTEGSHGPGVAGLDIFGNGRSCGQNEGELTVTKIERGDDGAVRAFAATYVQRCDGGTAAMRGTIHYYA
ncbi:hypothetical protein OKJ48_41590 [Streptomyces kunmingensis]|uniref:Uncharacterized protein n=1 Tax=Streptomyces kunmingensis TaxID=68225 RepID=A0ABU6CQH0_9ACTN|nr:hypothetical protein [Streptomyces kunmingensis]MEB3966679.1 hypothetical protein [Streptomyces kunmingensis]